MKCTYTGKLSYNDFLISRNIKMEIQILKKNLDSSLAALEKHPLSNLKPILENVCGIFSLASCREQYPCRKIIPKNITLKRLESAVRNILELTESEPLFFFINDKILRVDSVSLLIILLVFSNESHLIC